MLQRSILKEAQFYLTQFRALCIIGPRQSGKTTLSKILFKDKPYINFENPTIQLQAELEPEIFLQQYKKGAIFDEVQRVPKLFRYIQIMLDKNTKRGQLILTGSNNFLLQEQVSQSLAGRAGYLTLLPLSYAELKQSIHQPDDVDKLILTGGYPEIWKEQLNPSTWHHNYIQTYVQRDVRLLKNISNLATFNKFIYLCANFAGQLINRDEIAKLTGIDTKTVLSWLGLLENSYILYTLQPWHNNMNKRIVKSAKLYFYDTGLLCNLLGIKNISALQKHSAYGALFENWVITEIKKNKYNTGNANGLYFFRDSIGNEVDLINESDGKLNAIEIKAATKVTNSMYKGLQFWLKNNPKTNSILLHKGNTNNELNDYLNMVSWKMVEHIQ